MPALLEAVAHASGRQLERRLGELCERVLHQGTIYSASAPAVHELIGMASTANARERVVFYTVLGEFASSARQAVRMGHAVPCCNGGDAADGAAILAQILEAHGRFAPDLGHSDAQVRGLVANLLTASVDAGAAEIRMVRDRYTVEADALARLEMLRGLRRVRGTFSDWREFLAAAIERERDRANRCALRRAEVREWKSEASEEAVEELVATSLETDSTGVFDVLADLGEEREVGALLRTLAAATDRDILRRVAERLLRVVFHDQRSGWGDVSYRIAGRGESEEPQNRDWVKQLFLMAFKAVLLLLFAKMFPFLMRRKLRKTAEENARRAKEITYWGVKEAAPEMPAVLSADQRRVLQAIVDQQGVWFDSTNLWGLFGLPATADGLREFVAAH